MFFVVESEDDFIKAVTEYTQFMKGVGFFSLLFFLFG